MSGTTEPAPTAEAPAASTTTVAADPVAPETVHVHVHRRAIVHIHHRGHPGDPVVVPPPATTAEAPDSAQRS